jgi:iron complex outermembrane recepter protein
MPFMAKSGGIEVFERCFRSCCRFLGAAAFILSGAAPVWAADPATPIETGAGELEQIVVTAEKRVSTVLQTPISITAVSGDELLQRGISSLNDLALETPGISMKQFSPAQTEFEMRGLPSTGGSSTTVGFYINDVPMAASANSFNGKPMIDPDLYDLQRVEVLRGPQGTLYGAGSMGGTIRLITAEPEFSKLLATSQSVISDTKNGGVNWRQAAMVNLPLVDDRLALRLVGSVEYDPGWITDYTVSPFPYNETGGSCGFSTCTRGNVTQAPVVAVAKGVNWERMQGDRAALLFEPTDKLTIDASFMYQDLSLGGFPQVDQSPGVSIQDLAHYQPYNVGSSFKDTFRIASLALNYDLGFARLTSASGYWNHESNWVLDASEWQQYAGATFFGISKPNPTVYPNTDSVRQWSQEFRLTSQGDSRLQWVTGIFYSDFKSRVYQFATDSAWPPISVGGAAANPLGINFAINNPYWTSQWAAFAESSYKLTDTLKATVGVRYFQYTSKLDSTIAGVFAPTGNATPTYFSGSTFASGTNPKFNLSYQPTDTLNIYGQVAKGFRPGGINYPPPATLCKQPNITYGPDSVWDYEIGEKTRLAGGRITINSDFYYNRWNNVQQYLVLPCTYQFSTNAGTAETYGPEIEIAAQATQRLALSLNGSYTVSHLVYVYPSLAGSTLGASQPLESGDPLFNVPSYSITEAATYTVPLNSDYELSARLSATTTGPTWDINYYVGRLPGYTAADLRLGLAGGHWRTFLFAHNLTDKIAVLTASTMTWIGPLPPIYRPAVTTPRTIGVEVNYAFGH